MDRLPKIVQRHLSGNPKAGVHPDPDLLTAFAEETLHDRERSQVLQHLAECVDCREVLALAMPPIEAAPSPRPETSSWLSWPRLRWGALAACVVVVSAAVTLHYQDRQSAEPTVEERVPAGISTGASNIPQKKSEEQAAKLAPPLTLQTDRDLRAPSRLAKQTQNGLAATMTVVPEPSELDQKLKAQEPTRDRLAKTLAAKSADQPASAAAPPPLPAAEKPVEGLQTADSLNKVRRDATDHAPGAMAEMVTVDGAGASTKEMSPTAPRNSKDESSKNESQRQRQTEAQITSGRAVGGAPGDRKVSSLSDPVAQTASGVYAKREPAANAFRWTISADGMLQRSLDSGKTWQTIPVAKNVVFRALATNDSDIWVGGAAGTLYHSSDAGQNWVQVSPVADGKPLAADIVAVDFSDAEHGKVTTGIRETWTTSDAGRTWHRY